MLIDSSVILMFLTHHNVFGHFCWYSVVGKINRESAMPSRGSSLVAGIFALPPTTPLRKWSADKAHYFWCFFHFANFTFSFPAPRDVYYDDFCSAEQCVVAPFESRRGRAPRVAFSKQKVGNECVAACASSARRRARFHTKPC